MTSPRTYSLVNRCLDGLLALPYPARRRYRQKLLRVIGNAKAGWGSSDYGAGYLYQSFPPFGLRGFRQTESRVAEMAINSDLAGQNVLEIGCNSGFLSLLLSAGTQRFTAFDNNPFLIEIARLTQDELGDATVDFRVDTVEAFRSDETYDRVLSFANHSTWDGNMSLGLDAYFAKLQSLLVPSGLLFFESHHPALEDKKQLHETLRIMQKFFCIETQTKLVRGSPWDRGRTFVRARSLVAS